MKKGDIVVLKEDSIYALKMSTMDVTAWGYSGSIEYNECPKELTVESAIPKLYCGSIQDSLRFSEIPGTYNGRYFTVVLKAGEPDTEQLMKESIKEPELITSPWGVII